MVHEHGQEPGLPCERPMPEPRTGCHNKGNARSGEASTAVTDSERCSPESAESEQSARKRPMQKTGQRAQLEAVSARPVAAGGEGVRLALPVAA